MSDEDEHPWELQEAVCYRQQQRGGWLRGPPSLCEEPQYFKTELSGSSGRHKPNLQQNQGCSSKKAAHTGHRHPLTLCSPAPSPALHLYL